MAYFFTDSIIKSVIWWFKTISIMTTTFVANVVIVTMVIVSIFILRDMIKK